MNDRIVTAEGKTGRVVCVRLKPGCDVLEGLTQACIDNNIKNGVLVSALGSLSQGVLYKLKKVENSKAGWVYGEPFVFEGPLEIVGSGGVICHDMSGEINLHIHISFGDVDFHTWGGHIAPGTKVLITLDAVIMEVDEVEMERILDEEMELPILTPRRA